MKIHFTKMQGAGNDFVVLDETQARLNLTAGQYRYLADRHFGVGADQILTVRPSPGEGIDFEYVIHNADGGEVGQCGNGSRCFARYVRDKGLTTKDTLRVQTLSGILSPKLNADGRVTVDMGVPVLDEPRVPFDAAGLSPTAQGSGHTWPLSFEVQGSAVTVPVAVASMGNPHAVQLVDNVDTAPVGLWGPLIESHKRFPERVNAGFMQIVDRGHVRLRVFERGTGETLACGSGACAAVATGIRLGLLDNEVHVDMHGGRLTISWCGSDTDSLFMTGPATTVFEGQIDIPDAA